MGSNLQSNIDYNTFPVYVPAHPIAFFEENHHDAHLK